MEKSYAAQGAAASPHEFAIRPARTEDVAAILKCLRAAFEPYRSQYTPQAWLDTVPTPDRLLHRLTSMTVLVAVSAEGNIVGIMPHPERAADRLLGLTGGSGFFTSLMTWHQESKMGVQSR